MLTEIGTEQLLYFLIPIIIIILGIYFLIIHQRKCPSCGRPIRPIWRECSCASEESPLLSTEQAIQEVVAQEPEVESTAEIKTYSYDDAQPLSGEGMGIGTEVMLPSIPSAWLLIEEEGMPEKKYDVKAMTISIGTSDDNDIILKDKAVSRHHAKIRIEGKKYFIYDLASTNGTRVNGRKIAKKWIKEGDSIEIGHTRMTFNAGEIPEYTPSDLLKM
ncbi:MAG: FHA domain-containing protein [Candidatus Aenigmarchaeota archaeon]|nr:FHA domain-containing protein [Candidatus Aenigmarchaeota archaeon]